MIAIRRRNNDKINKSPENLSAISNKVIPPMAWKEKLLTCGGVNVKKMENKQVTQEC